MGPSRQEKFELQKAAAIQNGSKFVRVSLAQSQVTGELHYKLDGEEASKQLVVFIHGIGGGMLHFREQMTALASSGYRVLGLDFFGRGLSLPPTKTGNMCSNLSLYDAHMHIEQIHCLLHELQLLDFPDITLCGFSMGGAICMRFLDEYALPNIKKVVLFSPAGMLDPMPIISCFRCCCLACVCSCGINCLTSCLGSISTPQEEDDRKAFHVMDTPVADEMVRCTAEYAEVNDLQTAVFKSAAKVTELVQSSVIVSRVLKEQRKIQFLFIWAQEDQYVPVVPSMDRYQTLCARERGDGEDCGYRFEVLEKCGHCSMLEATERVNDLLFAFLNEKNNEIEE
mgnify:CR=1 FL=1